MNELPGSTTWYLEYISPELVQGAGLRRTLFSGRTQYQQVSILETGPFGRCLILDGKIQSAEADDTEKPMPKTGQTKLSFDGAWRTRPGTWPMAWPTSNTPSSSEVPTSHWACSGSWEGWSKTWLRR